MEKSKQSPESQDLPSKFQLKSLEALMGLWWTSLMLKKTSSRLFQDYLASDAQFNIMKLLKDATDPLTQNDLSKMLLVDKSNVTGLIDRLEKQNYIRRNKVEGDRRSYHITLTEEGQALIAKLDRMYLKKVSQIMSEFVEEDYEHLIRLTRKIRNGVRSGEGKKKGKGDE
ncbi:MAG: MarR family transcriptional regulator [Bacteroidota bacterium]